MPQETIRCPEKVADGSPTCDAVGTGRLGSWLVIPSSPHQVPIACLWEWLLAPKNLFAHMYITDDKFWHWPVLLVWYFEGPFSQPPVTQDLDVFQSNLESNWFSSNLFCVKFQFLPPAWLNQSISERKNCVKKGRKLKKPFCTWGAPSISPSRRFPPVSAQLLSSQKDPSQLVGSKYSKPTKIWKVTKMHIRLWQVLNS